MPRPFRSNLIVVIRVVSALLAGGCGSDDSSTPKSRLDATLDASLVSDLAGDFEADARHDDANRDMTGEAGRCDCVAPAEWTSYQRWYGCECLQINWGCRGKTKHWSSCDLQDECFKITVDPNTGCSMPSQVGGPKCYCSGIQQDAAPDAPALQADR